MDNEAIEKSMAENLAQQVASKNGVAGLAVGGCLSGGYGLPVADEELRLASIIECKALRKELDSTLQRIKCSRRQSRERSLVVTKLQEAIMWLGMDLKDLGAGNPYPHSKN